MLDLGAEKLFFRAEHQLRRLESFGEGLPETETRRRFWTAQKPGSPASLLSLIPPPAGGYSVQFLRDAAGLGQALAYIRPLQKDLPMDAPVENTEQVRRSS